MFEETKLKGVICITPRRFADNRGFFSEIWNRQQFLDHGIDLDFVQDNHSLSRDVGTVRGLHIQDPPHAQAKLVRCGHGRLLDVAVDVRAGSPTYGQWVSEELSFENGKQLLIPTGFLHGFITLEADTEIIYKCSDIYAPQCEQAVRYDDPDININWGMDMGDVILSDKDKIAPSLKDFKSAFSYSDTLRGTS